VDPFLALIAAYKVVGGVLFVSFHTDGAVVAILVRFVAVTA